MQPFYQEVHPMSFGVDNTGGAQGPRPSAPRIRAAATAGADGPAMAGDTYTSSKGNEALAKEMRAMTPEQASSAVSTGGTMIGFGVAALAASYWGAGLLAGATALGIGLPVALGLAGVGLALWGATKLAKGLGAKMDQAVQARTKGIDDILGGN